MKKIFFLMLIPMVFGTSCDKNSNIVVFKKKIVYEVSGTATEVLVTYVNDKGDTEMTGLSTNTLPWKYEFKARPETYVYLQAKNTTDAGTVEVQITQGNAVLFDDDNDMPYGAASCSGFVK